MIVTACPKERYHRHHSPLPTVVAIPHLEQWGTTLPTEPHQRPDQSRSDTAPTAEGRASRATLFPLSEGRASGGGILAPGDTLR